jgi:hypothetical protein
MRRLNDRTAMLLSVLDDQRRHVLGILEGLSEVDLRRPVLPTGWTCLGLVQHLALDVEQFWFVQVVAGEPAADDWQVDDTWQVPPSISGPAVLDLYRHQVERATAVIRAVPLDATPKYWPEDLFGTWRMRDLEQIMLHVITETACHAGHLDAARELIDGRTWLVLTG